VCVAPKMPAGDGNVENAVHLRPRKWNGGSRRDVSPVPVDQELQSA
jgi:hypothetical protein